jgi:hypothetical protein
MAKSWSMRSLFPVLFTLLVTFSHAQTVLENNPPSVKWRQISTPNFKVLYPPGFDDRAQRVANSLERVRDAGAQSLGSRPRRMTFIMQNRSSLSNGFVSIIPRRSEFYTMPTQDYNFVGTNDWLEMLTAHEYRHVVQYQHATRGFNKAIYYLFGSISLAGMAQAAAPPWFWEGDAVVTETAITPSGRGKIPEFGLLMRTNFLTGRTFNYHKQVLGSYKHRIPNEYVLGFHMVSYLRRKTNDPDIWGRITARSWSVPFIPFAFSNAIKKETGMYVTDLYKEMAREWTAEWKRQLEQIQLSPFVRVNLRRSKAYTDYAYPQPLPEGGVLAMKRGIGDIERFVILKNGEEKVFTPGLVNDAAMLSASGNILVWNEYGLDPRWLVRNYSQIKALDLATGRKFRVGPKRSRYSSAAVAPGGDRIVTIETDLSYQTSIVVLSTVNGRVLKRFPNEENAFYSMPRWSNDGKTIAVLKTVDDGKTVSLIDYESGSQRDVLPVSHENIGHPVLHDHYLLFNTPGRGIDNIHALDLTTGKRYEVTSSQLGAYNPSVSADGTTIYYNDQTRDGLDVVSIPFNPATWRPYVQKQSTNPLYSHLVEQEGNPDVFKDLPDTQYPVAPYRKLSGIINPYNWGLSIDNDLREPSVGVLSRDILSTTTIGLGYYYDISERTSSLRGQISYQGLFPIIDVSASYSNRSVDEGSATFYDTLVDPVASERRNVKFKWKEKNVEAGLRVPLITTTSKYHGSITIGNSVGLTQVTDFENNIDGGGRLIPRGDRLTYFFRDYVDNGELIYNRFSLVAYRLLKRSARDINSRWGQQLEIDYFDTPFGGDFDGRQFTVLGILYFPGFAKHHSIWGYGAYQHTKLENVQQNYVFRNQAPGPRGLTLSRFQQFYSASVNYTMPLWYPDIAVGPILNIQRLRTTLFLDYGFGESKLFQSSQEYLSTGAEAKVDINIMRFRPQFDIGVRFSKGLQPSTSMVELLIGAFNF